MRRAEDRRMQVKKRTGQMSVDDAMEELSDEESKSSHGVGLQISENVRIEVKPQTMKHESLLPEEEFKRQNNMIAYQK